MAVDLVSQAAWSLSPKSHGEVLTLTWHRITILGGKDFKQVGVLGWLLTHTFPLLEEERTAFLCEDPGRR